MSFVIYLAMIHKIQDSLKFLGDFFPVEREAFSGGVLYRIYPHVYTGRDTGKGQGEHLDHGGVSGPGEGTHSPGQVSL